MKWYFYCHRSGSFKAKGNGKQAVKCQGSCKIENFCTAHMKVFKSAAAGRVNVQYCQMHTGHEVNIGHLRISNEIKLDIAHKLLQGVSID